MFKGEAAPFLCGRWLGRAWEEEVGGDGFDSRIGDFLVANYDLNDCRARPVTTKELNEYLKNHQEYKNESH